MPDLTSPHQFEDAEGVHFQTPPTVAARILLNMPADLEEDFQPDNYDMDNNDEYSLSDKMVHYVGGHIAPEHWPACKACLVFSAGCMVSKMTTMTKVNMQNTCLQGYRMLVNELDTAHFCADARAYFLSSFRKKEDPLTGEPLYRYFQDSRNKMRSLVVPLLPQEFMTMKSGRGFHETCNNIIVAQYRKDLLVAAGTKPGMTVEEAEQKLPPMFWEYRKSPWMLFLCVKIFRRNPHLAPNVVEVLGDISNRTQSRASLKRKAQAEKYQKMRQQNICVKKEVVVVDLTTAAATAAANNRNTKQVIWAKVHMAKAMQESANVARRLGEIEATDKSLGILDRMRPIIGEEAYMERVKLLFASIPLPTSFAKDCEVICVDAGDSEQEEDNDKSVSEDGISNVRIPTVNIPPQGLK